MCCPSFQTVKPRLIYADLHSRQHSLTDAQILAALPVESQRKIDSAFEALSQSLPTDKERIILYRVAHTLKLNPTDTHFSVLAAMHYYLQLYETIPNLIVRAGGEVVEAGKSVDTAIRKATKEAITEHKQALENQAKLVSFDSQKALIEMVGKTAQKIAGDSAAAQRADAMFWAAVAMSVFSSLFFCLGLYLGSRSLGWVWFGGLTLFTGVLGGMAVLAAITQQGKALRNYVVHYTTPASQQQPTYKDPFWSEAEFNQAVSLLNANLSSCMLQACKDVLVNGKSSVDAGRLQNVLPAQISRKTSELSNAIKK